ncbi:uncharacterized protein LOC129910918 [Episyrphus balteatus]|uniref:uncharacterized protein LOC129910918 n=1 Tax=Episyrphus balteatus TaxID=286459 RepID=UPI0024850B2A|nr:uncharacterized protein LOC129910918 [Episyrphus balteatus]
MSKFQEELTFDCIPDTIDEFDLNENGHSVLDEINRCRHLYKKRQVLKRQKAIDIKPLYYEQMRRRDLVAKYPVYKFWYTSPKPPKKPDPCSHVGRIILDRDILTKNEHISFLAQPKADLGRKVKPPQWTCQKRYLPNCTTRVESLAHPKTIRVQHNCHDFQNILSVRQATNLRKTLQKPPLEYTAIENAITYIHEERRLKNIVKSETIRKCNQIKQKLLKIERKQMLKIIYALYEVMKEFLVGDQLEMSSDEVNSLSKVLERKITEFCDCDDSSSTSHVRQLLKTVSINLAIWIEKFTSNCGFKNAHVDKESEEDERVKCKEMENPEFLLPVEDYISYHSMSTSEDFVDAEEFGGENEYEDEGNY